ncbi:MAG: tRNA pseudouridine(55) synthase TruB [Elusimicrobiota bacterium]|jgi:tRNA pseudouridine55 synthase|nr:tRNA pseudouridine(55) synthase TruB [Elusimicrobiota bacterium]
MTALTAGILLVDKPRGWTSHDAVAVVRGRLKIKTGHSGTLDPMATGLLVILLGGATKKQDAFQKMPKTYEGEITLGAETDTWDAEGRVIKTAAVPQLLLSDIETAAAQLTGDIVQPVPFYSAKKVNGAAMYKAARAGNNIEKQTTVRVYGWRDIKFQDNKITFTVNCGSGTYVRSLAQVMGRLLGAPAHLSALRRTACGGFEVAGALPAPALKTMPAEEILKCVKIV